MRQAQSSVRDRFDLTSLELSVEHARLALACPFSNSSEYEAALIRSRRAAGVYGPRRHTRTVIAIALGIAFVVACILAI